MKLVAVFFFIFILIAFGVICAKAIGSVLRRALSGSGSAPAAEPMPSRQTGRTEKPQADSSHSETRIPFARPHISGKCEICGKEFSASDASARNYLSHVSYVFYGRKREKMICSKCLRLLRTDKNFSQK